MKLVIGDTEIPLERKDVVLARSAVNAFIETARMGTLGTGNPGSTSLYFTTLLMMFKKSNELLSELGIDNVRYVMELLNSGKEEV